ncbi:hypothetical protein [Pedobacter sp.]|uniref:hypothetical protein n=1 Tax=Pedobacter sp. TaxID=1411316 RepID=UPI003D7F4464
MKAELLNEFYLLQQSRSNEKYLELLDEKVYTPVKKVNIQLTNWVSRRGLMLMNLESVMNRGVRRFKKRYFKF